MLHRELARTRRAAPLLAVVPLASMTLGAQVVRGTVRDGVTHQPLGGATIAVIDDQSMPIKVLVASEAGEFSVALPRAGVYGLDLRRLGYTELVTTTMHIGVGDTVKVDLDMAPAAARTLDTVRTKARNDSTFLTQVTPGHVVFAKHYALGKGIFASGEAIEKSGMSLTEYLGHEEGVRLSSALLKNIPVVPGGRGEFLVSNLKTQCLYARIDHWSVVRRLVQGYAANIDEIVQPKDVMAVEFYRDISEVPVEWRTDAALADLWTRSYSRTFGYTGSCATDRYAIGSTDMVDPRTITHPDTAYSCPPKGRPFVSGYAASHPPNSPAIPICGFMQIWTKISW